MRWLLALALLAGLPGLASAQTLGQAAAKERAKRAKSGDGKPAPTVFTNDDLASEKEKQKQKEKEEQETATEELSRPIVWGRPGEPPPRSGEGPRGEDAPRPRRMDSDDPRAQPERSRRSPAPSEAGDPAPAAPSPTGQTIEEQQREEQWRERVVALETRRSQASSTKAMAQSRADEIRGRLNPMSATYEQDPGRIMALQQQAEAAEAEAKNADLELDSVREAYEQLAREAALAGVPRAWVQPPQ
jgi:hypothetical protein